MLSISDLEAFKEDMERFSTPLELVKTYYNTAGIEPEPGMAADLIFEEFSEWNYADSDLETLKELADLVFVIYGYAISMGWDLDEAFYRVYKNNIARMKQDDGSIKRREDGKIVKNPATPKVEMEDLV